MSGTDTFLSNNLCKILARPEVNAYTNSIYGGISNGVTFVGIGEHCTCQVEFFGFANTGHGLDIIYLDYRKAFDIVPHQALIMKLRENIALATGFQLQDDESTGEWNILFLSSCTEWCPAEVRARTLAVSILSDLPEQLTYNIIKMYDA